MRTLKTSVVSSSTSSLKLSTLSSEPPVTTPPAATVLQKSPWHSPVPYLFGGLAAMLGLIAFALLLLACSYWRLSAANSASEENRDIEQGEGGAAGDEKPHNPAAVKVMPIFEEKIVVIMAGDIKPTFLATPISNKAISSKNNENLGKGMEEIVEKPKFEVSDQNILGNVEDDKTHEEAAAPAVGDGQEQN
ncbi:OLC1v1030553C1 [Oldenlandia corymbosa var. corymbosa]|uniref:OLC1v1030553C1 n=1 Tax=Oldenlandia corymbosa var. corymbosa TaxID=529605 RepID=A0AAV1CH68_OLDCO|nr:OLC1v1030553C1 [Oldenlandia corymbosa var. corymbosa]